MTSEQICIPDDFFVKTLREYSDWRFAWFREVTQNAADAGATRIAFAIHAADGKVILSATDNGSGMDEATLRTGLLTLGGSVKDTATPIGGFGYAKHVILLAHRAYQVRTRDLVVTGRGGHYSLQRNCRPWVSGTQVQVEVADDRPEPLQQACVTLGRNARLGVTLTLNGRALRRGPGRYDYTTDTDLGTLRFSEDDDSTVSVWVRMGGLPMFRYYVGHCGERGLFGVLDLAGGPTDVLTANRDGLLAPQRRHLDGLLLNLIQLRELFRTRNRLSLVLNRSDPLPASPPSTVDNPTAFTVVMGQQGSPVPSSPHPFTAIEADLQDRLRAALRDLAGMTGSDRYPPNFWVDIVDLVLRRKRGQDDVITVADIRRHLSLQRTQKVAWAWDVAVAWVLEADYWADAVGLTYDDDRELYLVNGRPIRTGFCYHPQAEGLHRDAEDMIAILVNPLSLDQPWLIGDLVDLAIHECTHLVVAHHGERFNAVEGTVRKELRRLVNDRQVQADAREAMREAGLLGRGLR